MPTKKPAPDIYLHVLEELGLKADECLAFEDSENGVLSSLEANLATIVTTNTYTKDHDFSGATLVLDQYGEPDQSANVLFGNMDKTCLDIEGIQKLYDEL